jgi:glycerate 2-kinase
MSLDREDSVRAFESAVEACDPEQLVARGKDDVVGPLAGRTTYGLALGKAALKMARGAGPVARGVIVTNADDGLGVPSGWHVMIAAHPEPDARSVAAGEAVIDLIAGAAKDDLVIAMISGGASSLVEWPAPGVTLDELRARVAACMASGAEIHAINRLRGELSALKAGKLARLCEAPIATLAISDVYDDDLAVIGSGPTIANRPGDRAAVIAPMRLFAESFERAYCGKHAFGGYIFNRYEQLEPPLTGSVDDAVRGLDRSVLDFQTVRIRYGEPTVEVPADHGEGGRAQQLALALARELRLIRSSYAFVAGSDGIDGPAPARRSAPAGAFVDHESWDKIAAAGIDPEDALARCDAGTALDAIGALVVTGPTGINHGDVMLVG